MTECCVAAVNEPTSEELVLFASSIAADVLMFWHMSLASVPPLHI